jgi:dihydroneopterin aldolase
MERFTISLQDIELYAFHGLYPAEKELGAKYLVNLEFTLLLPAVEKVELSETVDYKKAYNIVTEEFKTDTLLLENLCKRIAARLKAAFPVAEKISISVSKLSPPLGGICKAARVSYELN